MLFDSDESFRYTAARVVSASMDFAPSVFLAGCFPLCFLFFPVRRYICRGNGANPFD